MALFVIATPLGDINDLSARAREQLSRVSLIIGEEAKPTRQLLSKAGLAQKPIELLNEHSTNAEIAHLAELAKTQDIALVSDCGTPGFCDPGAELVAACRKQNIAVQSIPGPSSLMSFISVLGIKLESFVFWGFLPRDPTDRESSLKNLNKEKRPIFVFETPYRLHRLLDDLDRTCPDRPLVLALELSLPTERLIQGRAREIKKMELPKKTEFIVYLHGLN